LLIQIAILFIKILIDVILKFINEFPLFLLLNYIFNSSIFPHGIRYKIVNSHKGSEQPAKKKNSDTIQFLKLQEEKIPMNSLLAPFISKLLKITQEYKIINLPSSILKGLHIGRLMENNESSWKTSELGLTLSIKDIWEDAKCWFTI
jgi:hypothetical protein